MLTNKTGRALKVCLEPCHTHFIPGGAKDMSDLICDNLNMTFTNPRNGDAVDALKNVILP